MKTSYQFFLNLAMVLFILAFAIIFFETSRKNSREVEIKIDTLSSRIDRMNLLTLSVVENLQETMLLIGDLSVSLESSGRQLDSLLSKSGMISSQEKNRIRTALNEIRKTRLSIEEEQKKALQLIGELNTSRHDDE